MIERFLFFRDEITELLKEAKGQPKETRQNYKLMPLSLKDVPWGYLSTIIGILKLFFEATTNVQGDTYETSNMTIPYVCGILKSLAKWESQQVAQTNPLIAMGLQEAHKKLLQYYPVYSDNIEPIKDLYIATVLDPRMKLSVFKDLGISDSTICAIEAYFFVVLRRYRQELSAEENGVPKRRQGNEERRQSGQAAEEMSDLFYREQSTAGDDDGEIRQYLTQARSSCYLYILEFYGTQKSYDNSSDGEGFLINDGNVSAFRVAIFSGEEHSHGQAK